MIQLLQTAMPPSNLSYLVAAFLVTGVILIGYVFFVFRRRQETRKSIERLKSTVESEEDSGPGTL